MHLGLGARAALRTRKKAASAYRDGSCLALTLPLGSSAPLSPNPAWWEVPTCLSRCAVRRTLGERSRVGLLGCCGSFPALCGGWVSVPAVPRAPKPRPSRRHQGNMVKCGKPQCACRTKPSKRHGPYYEWTYKAQGKTVNVRLSAEAAPLFQAAAKQYRKLKSLLTRLEKLSRHALSKLAKDVTRRPPH